MTLQQRHQALWEVDSELSPNAPAIGLYPDLLAAQARLEFVAGDIKSAALKMGEAAEGLERVELDCSQASIWRDLGIYQLAVGQIESAKATFKAVREGARRHETRTGSTSSEYLHLHVHLAAEMFGTKAALGALEEQLLPLLISERGGTDESTLAVQLLRSILLNLTGQYDAARQNALALLTTSRELYPDGLLSHLVISTAVAWSEIGLDRFVDAAERLRTALGALTSETSWSPSIVSYALWATDFSWLTRPSRSD
jgi:tetratricopeptide (TPR) repeat protein